MTDFLTSLAARSFGTGTAIPPRVASLFEPVRNGDAALREPAAEPIETTIAREVEVESDGERERKRNRPAPALREDGKASNAKHSADANSVSPVVSPPRNDSERPRTTVLAAETSEKEDTVVAAKVRPRRVLVSQAENANESEPALRSDSEDGTQKRVSTKAAAASAIRDESSENDHRGLVLPPKIFPELTAQMKNAALAMNVGPGTPKREKAESAWPALAAEPEPSVHVTIGRIEVRATSESKQVGRPRTASPVMSLEEYLHRRTQRGGQ
jgi:hypothetical protein